MAKRSGKKQDRKDAGSVKQRRRTIIVRIAVILIILAMLVPFLSYFVRADGLWSEEYFRANCTTEDLSEAEQTSLDEDCLSFLETYHLDISLLALKNEETSDGDLSATAEGYYQSCNFGYGEGKDGFQMIWNLDTDEILIVPFGTAAERVPESYLTYTAQSVISYKEEYGVYGPMYATYKMLANYLDAHGTEAASGESSGEESAAPESGGETQSGSSETESGGSGNEPAGASHDPSERVGEGSDMPAWYPKYPDEFPFYHDENAPRIVDDADILTEEEEAALEAFSSQIRSEIARDIVIFTDMSTHGLSRAVYAADFYDYNGYGCGEGYDGVCLFVCMDPDNRGWWCCCTGPNTEDAYTEDIANQIDDILYEYMKAGRYGDGFMDWMANIRRYFRNGSPYTEDWLADGTAGTEPVGEAASRIRDDADILTEEEIAALSEKAAGIRAKYGVDVVVSTSRCPTKDSGYGITRSAFAEKYYNTFGYGLGEDRSGIELIVFRRPEYNPYCKVAYYGAAAEKLTEAGDKRLTSRCDGVLGSDQYYRAIDEWLDQSDHVLRTGRAPRKMSSWIFVTALEVLAGVIVGAAALGRAKRKMETPEIRVNADAYLVKDSLRVREVENRFLHTSVSKQYSPVERDSSSGGSSSSGRSSYSSHYSGSSGRSHSGSGRSF